MICEWEIREKVFAPGVSSSLAQHRQGLLCLPIEVKILASPGMSPSRP